MCYSGCQYEDREGDCIRGNKPCSYANLCPRCGEDMAPEEDGLRCECGFTTTIAEPGEVDILDDVPF